MTAELVERLRAGLEGVTRGPWIAEQLSSVRDKTTDRLYVAGPSEVVCGNDGICEPAGCNDRTFTEDAANMRHIANCSPDNICTLLDTIESLRARMAEVEGERDDARRKLFPYADATEISGMSWNGFYLIGDDKSIKELRRIENRSAQIEVYRQAFDERIAIAESRASSAEETVRELRDGLEQCASILEDIAEPKKMDMSVSSQHLWARAIEAARRARSLTERRDG